MDECLEVDKKSTGEGAAMPATKWQKLRNCIGYVEDCVTFKPSSCTEKSIRNIVIPDNIDHMSHISPY